MFPSRRRLERMGNARVVEQGASYSEGEAYAIRMAIKLFDNNIVNYVFAKKNAQKLAYMQFLLYLCSRNITNSIYYETSNAFTGIYGGYFLRMYRLILRRRRG